MKELSEESDSGESIVVKRKPKKKILYLDDDDDDNEKHKPVINIYNNHDAKPTKNEIPKVPPPRRGIFL